MASERWQFWIDVGGTFTDCVARRPDGRFVTRKVLSSGVTKGSVGEESSESVIVDPARRADPPRFWEGYSLRLIDAAGGAVTSGIVETFDASTSTLRLAKPLDARPTMGQSYELVGDEEAPVLAIRHLLSRARRGDPECCRAARYDARYERADHAARCVDRTGNDAGVR
jgi:5-oxoprolinase (ATP-hydrolysing)